MRASICTGTPFLLLFVGLGCGPTRGKEPKGNEAKRYAEKICDAIAACGCYEFFDSPSACQAEYEQRFKSLVGANLQLDSDCFEGVVDLEDDDRDLAACSREQDTPQEWRCTVLRGTKQLGEGCSDHNLEIPPFIVNECEGDLVCLDGVCATFGSPGPERAIGDGCFAEQSLSCHSDGLFCTEDGICHIEALPGESCTSPFACARVDDTGSYCRGLSDGDGVCAKEGAAGDSCDPEDWFACGLGWCDPAENVCVASGPNICRLTDFPNARPAVP